MSTTLMDAGTDIRRSDVSAGVVTGTSVHLVEKYLPVTENWMFRRLKALKKYPPVVLAGRLMDAENYPLEHIEVLDHYRRIRYRILDRLTGKRFVFYDPNYRALRSARPRIIHSHFATEAVNRRELRAMARKRFGCATVCSFYGYDLRGLVPGQRWQGFDDLLQEETAFIVQGPRMAEHMARLGCDSSKIYVNPLGIDLQLFPERTTRYEGGRLRVLTVARLVEKKGVADAVRGVARARRAGIDITLTVAGDGPLRSEIESVIADENAGDFVSILGTVSYAALRPLYYDHDVCLQPSVTAANGDTEGGANMCIIEAMAAGLPVVATDHADTATTVAVGEHAFLAPERCPDQLADALVTLARDGDLWHSYSLAGRARACRLFDAEKQAAELEAVYDTILSRFGGSR